LASLDVGARALDVAQAARPTTLDVHEFRVEPAFVGIRPQLAALVLIGAWPGLLDSDLPLTRRGGDGI